MGDLEYSRMMAMYDMNKKFNGYIIVNRDMIDIELRLANTLWRLGLWL